MREAHIPFCIAIADIETARLEIVEVGCRAYLPVGILTRHPELNVILFDLPQPEVAAAIRDRAIGNIQKFDEFFGVAIQPLMQAHRLVMLGFTKDNLFPFEELMHADEAAHILAVRARLPAEARRECEELHGECARLKRFIHVITHRRDFARAREIFAVLRCVEVLLALRQIAGTHERIAAHQARHAHRHHSFCGKMFERQLPHGVRQQDAVALEEVAAEAGDLRSPLEIGDSKRGHELHMVLWREGKSRRGAPLLHFKIIGIARAVGYRHIRNVGYREHHSLPLRHHSL